MTIEKKENKEETMKIVGMIIVCVVLLAGAVFGQQNDSTNSLTVRWTAPGDDGCCAGTATTYDLRYLLTSITDVNWADATQVQNEPVPTLWGTEQNCVVTGLMPGVSYNLRIKAADENDNWSGLSNEVVVTTRIRYYDIMAAYRYSYSHTAYHYFPSIGSSFNYQPFYWDYNYFSLDETKFMVSGDFDGDGKDDQMAAYRYSYSHTAFHGFISTGSGYSYQAFWWDCNYFSLDEVKFLLVGDVNDDGKDDLIAAYRYGPRETAFHVFISTGHSFVYQADWWHVGYFSLDEVKFMVSGDFDADGKCDVMAAYRYTYGHTAFHVFRSMGNTFGYQPFWWDYNYFSLDETKFMVSGDFDKDGKCDVMAAYRYGSTETGFHEFTSTGTAFSYRPDWLHLSDFSLDNTKFMTAKDFTGDGKCDVMAAYRHTFSQTTFYNFSSTGSSLNPKETWWNVNYFSLDETKFILAGNFNGLSLPGMAKQEFSGDSLMSLPTSYTLSQNYPNPFNPTTTIAYALPEPSHVILEIYNIMGQRVTTLVDEDRPAGEHSVVWNASGQASGMYFCRLITPSYSSSQKMTLLK